MSVFLLELKQKLEDLTRKVDLDEIVTFTKFLILAVVILPAVPNQDFTRFALNPFKIWLMAVAVSAMKGAFGKCARNSAIWRYSGRKS